MTPSVQRPRRLRRLEGFRRLVRETRLSADQLVMPLFVRPGKNQRTPIPSMPGQSQLSVDQLVKECAELRALGVTAVLLFGIPPRKDERASAAYAADGVVPQAIAAIKRRVPELLIITDVCLCGYTTHGHCGVLTSTRRASAVDIDEPATLELLARIAVSHAKAGADLVAPSDMMDGRVRAIRGALDHAGFDALPIMSYAAKFASAFYGPFRDAAGSAPLFGDRRSYQLDSANLDEALREVELDLDEGADIILIKPALAYLDVIAQVKQTFGCPVAAYNVSGEYAMVKAAAANGWLDERAAWREILLGMRRAGADILITYWTKDAAEALRSER